MSVVDAMRKMGSTEKAPDLRKFGMLTKGDMVIMKGALKAINGIIGRLPPYDTATSQDRSLIRDLLDGRAPLQRIYSQQEALRA